MSDEVWRKVEPVLDGKEGDYCLKQLGARITPDLAGQNPRLSGNEDSNGAPIPLTLPRVYSFHLLTVSGDPRKQPEIAPGPKRPKPNP